MNEEQIERFRKMSAQLDALHQEVVSSAKKTPDKAISLFKVKFVNNVLAQANEVLGSSSPQLGFEQFDLDDLPTYSDVTLIVTQFVECAEKVRCENIAKIGDGAWHWMANGNYLDIVTTPPRGGR